MKLVLDEWIIREVIDTLYMAQTTLLGITGLDSQQEVAKKCANETAITRRISKAIDILQQSEQSEASVENYIQSYLEAIGFGYGGWVDGLRDEDLKKIARHFYKLGLNAKKEE